MLDDESAVVICKIGGPVCLFVCTPATAWMGFSVIRRDLAAGVHVTRGDIAGIVLVILTMFLASGYVCRIGLGWFGGKK